MSCGCGCCPKCGCSATCTCNNSLWSLESRSDFSYVANPSRAVAEEHEERYNFNGDNEHSSESAEFSGAGAYRYDKKGSSWGIIDNESSGGNYGCSAGTYNINE